MARVSRLLLSRSWRAGSLLACAIGCASPALPPVLVPAAVPVPGGAVLASYRAPPGCPDESAYIRSVESRAQTLQLSSGSTELAADLLRVSIQPDTASAGWIGLLQIEGVHALQREVRGQRCEDVALALALIAVLRLDARAPPARQQPAPDPLSDPLLPDRAVEIVRSQGPRRVETERFDVAEAPRRSVASRWQPSFALHLGYASAPSHALQARLRAELQLGPRVQSGSVAMGFGYASASDRNPSADLELGLITAHLDLCPLALAGAVFWLRGCAALSGGVLAVSVQARDDDLDSQSASRGWAALGPSVEAGLPLGSAWTLRLLAEGSYLLVRDRFEVERIVGDEARQPSQITRTLLYRSPFGSFAVLLGVGYAF